MLICGFGGRAALVALLWDMDKVSRLLEVKMAEYVVDIKSMCLS